MAAEKKTEAKASESPLVEVRVVQGHVEVSGLGGDEVKNAIDIYRSVVSAKLEARDSFSSYVNRALLEESSRRLDDPSQQQIRRTAALRERLLADEGFETYASLAELRNSNIKATRTWVGRHRDKHQIFTAEIGGKIIIPRVQITDSGELDRRIASLIHPLSEAGLGGWGIWAWLTSPTDRLSGEVPRDVVEQNQARAIKAASRYAQEIQQAQKRVA